MRRPLAFAAAALFLTACEQTLHLYQPGVDAGATGGLGGRGGAAGTFVFGTGGMGGGFGGSGGDQRCQGSTQPVQYTPDVPKMLVVLDRSTAMVSQNLGMYSQLVTALNALSTLIYDYPSTGPNKSSDRPTIQFSYMDFPDSDPSNCQSQMACCASSVQSDFSHFSAGVMNCTSPSSNCTTSASHPISIALSTAKTALDAAPSSTSSPRWAVLIADGSPSGTCVPLPSNDCIDAEGVAAKLVGDDIKLSVVGIGDQTTVGACLSNLATPAGNAGRYYPATSDNDLYGALQQIASAAVCNVTLTNPPPPSVTLQVNVGFTNYQQNDPNGWSYDPTSARLHLHGTMCDQYSMYGNLSVSAGCNSR
ncbi:MAG TPA: hypothetical protein VMT03_07800 [Polyangia bacterium]|nr:hypothetical protein [Polyangia bacterium]